MLRFFSRTPAAQPVESPVNPAHAPSPAPLWQASAWVHGVAWARSLQGAGFQLGYNTPAGFEPMTAGPVFPTFAQAIAHARRTGWIR